MRSATLFSGGEGAGLGMVAAGWEHAWGVEYDPKIAQVARDNGFNVLTADILQCDPANFEPVGWLHASPPCPNFSNAKTNAEETDNDIALAMKIVEFVRVLKPRIVTIENVYGYRKSKSWQMIVRAFLDESYQFNYWHVNMADYGVPQTRKRMIVIARRDGQRPSLPPATHSQEPQATLFGARRQWVGWYEAIEDLIPTLPNRATVSKSLVEWYGEKQPAWVLYEDKNRNMWGDGVRYANEPSHTITIDLAADRSKITGHFALGSPAYTTTTKCSSRFQSFPDSYALPESNSLACRIIGNAVPPLFMQRFGEWLK